MWPMGIIALIKLNLFISLCSGSLRIRWTSLHNIWGLHWNFTLRSLILAFMPRQGDQASKHNQLFNLPTNCTLLIKEVYHIITANRTYTKQTAAFVFLTLFTIHCRTRICIHQLGHTNIHLYS